MQSVLKYFILKIICACFSKNWFCGEKTRWEKSQTIHAEWNCYNRVGLCSLHPSLFCREEKKKRKDVFLVLQMIAWKLLFQCTQKEYINRFLFMKQGNLYEILQPSESGNFRDWTGRRVKFRQSLLTLIIECILSFIFSSIAPSIINKFEMLERTLPSRGGRFRLAPSSFKRWNAKCLAATERTLNE